ncbi:BamA/TamA family outer membrane protein [Mucilaginibacter ximonensis]|uniref:BamA/TamA family outer membrane protein n=1 Tax=Mucilaginibacter ximonensis TaxID=538021 RepID=A0ABW5Y703_9SPHI
MRLRFSLCALFFVLAGNQIFAQQNREIPIAKIHADTSTKKPKVDTTILSKKGKPQTDLYEVLSRLLNKNAKPAADSVTSKPVISVVPAVGYTLVSRLAIVLSGNVAFRTGPQSRVSTIVASTSYTQNKQFSIPMQTSIWSRNNNWNFIGDYRFYKYPQSTYGLGSDSRIQDDDPMDYKFIRFYENAYRRIGGNFYAGIGYMLDTHYDITDKGNIDGTVSDYERYGKSAHSIASGFNISTLFDSRNNGLNASKGAFVSLTYRSALTALGSTERWNSLMVDARKYFRFPANSENVIALWNFDWVILNGSPAYLDLPSLSWDSNSATGRGYIQGRFRGAQMFYGEAEYRFRVTGNGLIGGVVFANASTFSAQQGSKLQRIQPGFGPGLRVKLNKVSNTNIAIDYGFGMQGSRGLFIDVGEAF